MFTESEEQHVLAIKGKLLHLLLQNKYTLVLSVLLCYFINLNCIFFTETTF